MDNKNKLIGTADCVVNYINSGDFFRKPLKWLYVIFAVLNILAPFAVLIKVIDAGLFRSPAKLVIAFILIWIVLLAGCCLLAVLWWRRKDQLFDQKHDTFPVTPLFAHFVRTCGEWFGLLVGGVLFVCSIIAMIFLGNDLGALGLPLSGGFAVLMLPVYGFLTIFVSRYLSEWIKVFVAIADNTAKK